MSKNSYELYEADSQRENGKIHMLQSIIIELLLNAGVLGVCFCFISVPTARVVLLLAALLCCVYLNVLTYVRPEAEYLRMAPVAVGVLALLVTPASAIQGFLYLCNQCIQLWDSRFNQLIPLRQVANASVWSRMQILLFLLLLLGVLIHNMVKGHYLLRMTGLVAILLLLVSVFRMNMSVIGCVAMVTGWVLAWLSTSSIRIWSVRHLPVVAAGAAIALILGGAFSRYTGNASVVQLKDSIVKNAEESRYGVDTLPQGNMTKAENLVGSNEEVALKLNAESPNEMYLKGFVGGSFTGTNWQILQYKDYTDEQIAMMQWLNRQSFETDQQYQNYVTYTGDADTMNTSTVSVENVGADRRYLYVPYELVSLTSGKASMYRDYQLKARGLKGTSSYEFNMYDTDQPTETIVQKALDTSVQGADDYNQAENVYASYVKENYTKITDEQKAELVKFFFADGDLSDAGLYQITEQIRNVLQEQTTYTDNPPVYQGTTEFVSWFLNQVKKGNSAYYATIATLAYRAEGIPARYVEGYYLSNADATQYKNAGQTDITLTQANAHAWTEVYLDGVGWMPVEVVPGFFYAQYTTQKIIGTPQSTVNIMNQTDQQQLQGSTADSLDPLSNDKKGDEPTAEKVIKVIGICLLAALILWLLQFLVLAWYRLRRSHYQKKLNQANHEDASRMHYRHVCSVLKCAGVPVQEDFPYENIPKILKQYPNIEEYDCKRFTQLLQKVVFGQQKLQDAEYQVVQSFDENITKITYDSLDKRHKLIMKIWKALV